MTSQGTSNYRIPRNIKNSEKFTKEERPPYLRDDDICNAMSIESITDQISRWEETKARREANEIKAKKAEPKSSMKRNTAIKSIVFSEGPDDATTILHPQRFMFRSPVVPLSKYWDLYPQAWQEVYYSIYLEDVGLENVLGQKQIELLHDRRSEIRVHKFSNSNAGVDKANKTLSLGVQENGTADITTKDDWAKVVSLHDLMMALDNMVAAWTCFWPGDRSLVTLRRVVTKHSGFEEIRDQGIRRKLLEKFIDKILELNSRRAAQGQVPMTFKEMNEEAKESLESKEDRVKGFLAPEQEERKNRNAKGRQDSNKTKGEDFMLLKAKSLKVNGRYLCLDYNRQEGCKERTCRLSHACAYLLKGQMNKLCGEKHSKLEHSQKSRR